MCAHFTLSSSRPHGDYLNARDVLSLPTPPSTPGGGEELGGGGLCPGKGARKTLPAGDEKLSKLKPHPRAGKYISRNTDRSWESRFGLLPELDIVLPPNFRKSPILLTISQWRWLATPCQLAHGSQLGPRRIHWWN